MSLFTQPTGSAPTGSGVAYSSELVAPPLSAYTAGLPLAEIAQTSGDNDDLVTVLIKQGESLGLVYGLGSADLTGWTCAVRVKTNSKQVTPVYAQTLTELDDEDTRWTGLVSKAVTSQWEARRYIVVCDLYNAVTGEAVEYSAVLIVTRQGHV